MVKPDNKQKRQNPDQLVNSARVVDIRGHNLNRMCHSFDLPENGTRFKAFPEAYCQVYQLSEEQVHAVTDLDIKRLLQVGADLKSLQNLCGLFNLDVFELGSQQACMNEEEFRASLIDQGISLSN